jgi:hypothetical protein
LAAQMNEGMIQTVALFGAPMGELTPDAPAAFMPTAPAIVRAIAPATIQFIARVIRSIVPATPVGLVRAGITGGRAAIAAGAAIGFIGAAAAAAWAPPPPQPGLCWYYTDPSQRSGFWDACPEAPPRTRRQDDGRRRAFCMQADAKPALKSVSASRQVERDKPDFGMHRPSHGSQPIARLFLLEIRISATLDCMSTRIPAHSKARPLTRFDRSLMANKGATEREKITSRQSPVTL